ncbi:MAG: ATP-binding protein [Alcanivorax sp.]|nr:ATP-binding protein [Alcanivorax sp.]
MTARTIRDDINQARTRLFVGREQEKAFFARLAQPNGPLRLLYLCAPGGLGKSTLLQEYREQAERLAIPCRYVDARHLPSSPAALREALLPDAASLNAPVSVLLIDTFEMLTMLEGWFRDDFMPDLPASVRTVIASREPPSVAWRADPGWHPLMHIANLTELSDGEARDFLQRRQLDAALHERACALARGNPLALALSAELLSRQPGLDMASDAPASLLPQLMTEFMRGIDDPRQQLAVQASAIVRSLNAPMLAAMLDEPAADDLFAWLRNQTFMKSVQRGLLPHDLLRDVIVETLRQRDPATYETLIARAYSETVRQIATGTLTDHEQCALDLFFIQRDTFLVSKAYRLEHEQNCYCDQALPSDWPLALEMTRRHEGEAGAAQLAFWYARQPEGLVAVRDRNQHLAGFLFQLDVNRISEADSHQDPAVAAVTRYLATRPPLLPAQRAILVRNWMAADKYQSISAVQTRISAWLLFRTLTTDHLAYTFYLQPAHPLWEKISSQGGHHPLPDGRLDIAGHSRQLYVHDCLTIPPLDWIRGLHNRLRELPESNRPLMDEASFLSAVRAALRHFHDSAQLRNNPLLCSRRIASLSHGSLDKTHRTQVLRDHLQTHIAALADTDSSRCDRILQRAYIHPSPNQQAAAESLAMSERTYRRHLSQAVTRLSARLWAEEQQDIGT